MNTKAGGAKKRITMIKKFGSEKAWKQFMREIGQKGGRLGRTGGFYVNRELARTAGAKGGAASRRGPAKRRKGEIGVKYSAAATPLPVLIMPLSFWGRMRRLWKTL